MIMNDREYRRGNKKKEESRETGSIGYGTQDEENKTKENKNKTQYVLDTNIHN